MEQRLRDAFLVADPAADVADGDVREVAGDLGHQGERAHPDREDEGQRPPQYGAGIAQGPAKVEGAGRHAAAGEPDKDEVLKAAAKHRQREEGRQQHEASAERLPGLAARAGPEHPGHPAEGSQGPAVVDPDDELGVEHEGDRGDQAG